ncbi:chemotaxis protein [Paenibacillus sp. BIHB 4019]|uniref:Chemotaxis protein n=1 Tax=Paenibacillus sp. BIHB 4019 TaxID=1870819 RepID=A0A1B2DG92_9BACL|nr:methyl-accepting chemotaxis protein [Paenibacillus sp. BIHB 4019]ANY66747.1 chemotaxis protein [Paenibacillus sp. BIHB 4019]
MNIRKKLITGFAAVLLLTLAVGMISWFQFTALDKAYQNLLSDRVQKILWVNELKQHSTDQSNRVGGYIITRNSLQLDKYEEDRMLFAKTMKLLEASIENPVSIELAAKLKQLEAEYKTVSQEMIAAKEQDNMDEVVTLVETKGSPIAEQLIETADQLVDFQQSQLSEGQATLTKEVGEVQSIIMTTIVVAMVLGIALAVLIGQIIARPVQKVALAARQIADGDLTGADIVLRQKDEIGAMALDFNKMKHHLRQLMQTINHNAMEVEAASKELSGGAEQAVMASNHIAESVQQVSEASDQQSASITENKQAIEESAISIQRIADSAAVTSESSELALQQAERGSALLGETIGQLKQLHLTIDQSAAVIYELGEQSRAIEGITQFIREIANQTNLLSLNASIEAARAGEGGRGFAVVAGEVKKLAEQTGEASDKIAVFIRAMVDKVNGAVVSMQKGSGEVESSTAYMNQTGEAFEQVYAAIRTVTSQVQEVSASAEQLAASTEQQLATEEQLVVLANNISDNSQSVAAVCEEQLASMEEISASAEALSQMANVLRGEIQKFTFEKEQA